VVREECVVRAAGLARRGEPFPKWVRDELERVFAELRPRVVSIAVAMVKDRQTGEEVAHDGIAEAWRMMHRFHGTRAEFDAWVCEFTRNKARNFRRKWKDVLTEDGDIDPESPEISVLRALLAEERERVLADARAQLPRIEQDVLYDFERGLSYREITDLRGLGGSGARNELKKARNRLEGLLREELARRGHGSSFFRNVTG
jgi:RNA polymerase sigma factor (sigma-70 family)